MATQGPVVAMDIVALSARLLEVRELAPRARLAAQVVADSLPGSAVNLYIVGEQGAERVWIPQASAGDVSVTEIAVPLEQGALGTLAGTSDALVISGKELVREEYAHLHVRRTVQALAYVALKAKGDLVGAIEIVSFEGEMRSTSLAALEPVASVVGVALASASEYEQERHSTLSSITRLTQLYDIEKVLNSTLELDQLLPLIGSKFKELLECQALNVWLLEGDNSVTLMHQAGVDPTAHEGQVQKPGEGLAG